MVGTGAAIATRGLAKRYGQRVALDGLDLCVPTGSVYGFLGPNGAGKTTTMRILTGLVRPDAGSVELLGRPFGPARGGSCSTSAPCAVPRGHRDDARRGERRPSMRLFRSNLRRLVRRPATFVTYLLLVALVLVKWRRSRLPAR